jgi:hypothetical protein
MMCKHDNLTAHGQCRDCGKLPYETAQEGLQRARELRLGAIIQSFPVSLQGETQDAYTLRTGITVFNAEWREIQTRSVELRQAARNDEPSALRRAFS